MRILVLLMFLASGQAFGHIGLKFPEFPDDFVESASPACKEFAVNLQECSVKPPRCVKERFYVGQTYCLKRITACQEAGVSMLGYVQCERKETQRQLQEIQDQLQGIQEPAGESVSSASELEKIKKQLTLPMLGLAPYVSYRALNKAVRKVLESQCQKGEGDEA